jgi:segregation and condensation protein A
MELSVAGHQTNQYTIHTPVYEGPLDLLLDLIERAELEITSISLALVTDQYLAYIHGLEQVAAEEISAFLVIAAKLLQIKSEALLPRPPIREAGEEDPGEALARQLRIYKRFKEIAGWLETRTDHNLRTYLRIAPPPKVEGRLDLSDITIADLIMAAETIFAQEQEKATLDTVIAPPRITIREKIALIGKMLRSSHSTTFISLIGHQKTRLEVVVTFLALLELVKRYHVFAQQEQLFGDIHIQALQAFDEADEVDIEFE